MAISREFRNFIGEIFAPFGSITTRPVFGFTGLFAGEVMFGLAADERIYLRTDDRSREAYRQEGSKPLIVRVRKGEIIETSYLELPERLYDEPDELTQWAERAYDAAMQAPTFVKRQRKRMRKGGARQPKRRRKRS